MFILYSFRMRQEDHIQYAICQYLQLRGIYFHSVPNEAAGNNPRRQSHLISLGLRAGVADMVVFYPAGTVTYLEVKSATGRQSDKQRSFQQHCTDHGIEYHVVRSVEDVCKVLSD